MELIISQYVSFGGINVSLYVLQYFVLITVSDLLSIQEA